MPGSRESPGNGARPAASAQTRVCEALWEGGAHIGAYASRTLRPVEVILLARHREAFAGRVLELGCGAGRLTGYLIELGREVTGLDIAPEMVAHCRHAYPAGTFDLGDLRDLSPYADGSLDAIVASYNVLDVLDDSERRRTLRELHRMLAREGVVVLSSHNRNAPIRPPTRLRTGDPVKLAADVVRLPRRIRNRRRLMLFEEHHADYAILNDNAHDYAVLHYYVTRDAAARQLAEHGFELIECLDLDGRAVADGEAAAHSAELHYVARRAG